MVVLNCGTIHWHTRPLANYPARCNTRRWCIRRYILRSPYVPIFDYLQTKLWSRRRAPRCTLVIHDRYTRLLYDTSSSRQTRTYIHTIHRASIECVKNPVCSTRLDLVLQQRGVKCSNTVHLSFFGRTRVIGQVCTFTSWITCFIDVIRNFDCYYAWNYFSLFLLVLRKKRVLQIRLSFGHFPGERVLQVRFALLKVG